jgi:hypothetical protein
MSNVADAMHRISDATLFDIILHAERPRTREKKKHELKTKPLSHKTVHMNSLNAPFRLILASRGLSFSFVVYGLDLLVKVLFVFIVLAVEVPGLLR